MKPTWTSLLSIAVFCSSAFCAEFSGPIDRLDSLVHLTPRQRLQVEELYRREEAALSRVKATGGPRFQISQNREADVRALLTPEQRQVYDHTPALRGGGLNLAPPSLRVAELDRELRLSAAQKSVATQVFTEEYAALAALAPEEREVKGQRYRQAAYDQIRALLTPEQLAQRDDAQAAISARANADIAEIEKAVRECPALITRIGPILTLQRSSRSRHSDGDGWSGEARFQAVGERSTESIVASWRRKSANAPLELLKISGPHDEIFSR